MRSGGGKLHPAKSIRNYFFHEQVEPQDKNGDFMTEEEKSVPLADSFNHGFDLHFQETIDGKYPNRFPQSNAFRTVLDSQNDHTRGVTCLAVLYPTKKRYEYPLLVTGSEDRTVRFWNIWNNTHVLTVPFEDRITGIAAYNSFGANRLVIAIGGDKAPSAVVWDLATQESKVLNYQLSLYHEKIITSVSIIESNRKEVNSAAFLGPVAVLGSIDCMVTVWSLKHQSLIFKFSPESLDQLIHVSVYDRGLGSASIELITVTADKTVLFWRNENDRPYCKLVTSHSKNVTAVCFHVLKEKSVEGSAPFETCPILITAGLDKSIFFWDVETKEKIKKIEGHRDRITSMIVYDNKEYVISPLLITASDDMRIIVWNILTGEKHRIFRCQEKITSLTSITTEFGYVLAAGGNNSRSFLFNFAKTERIRKFHMNSPVTSLAIFDPMRTEISLGGVEVQDPVVLVGSTDQTISLFDLKNQLPLKIFDKHESKISAIQIFVPSPSENNPSPHPLVISADGKAIIKIWDLVTFKLVKECRKHIGAVFSLAIFDPRKCGKTLYVEVPASNPIPGKRKTFRQPRTLDMKKPMLFSAGTDGHVMIWDMLGDPNRDSYIDKIDKAHHHFIRSVLVHNPVNINDDPLIITGSFDRTAIIWNLFTREKLITLRNVHTDYIYCMALYDPYDHLGEKITIQSKAISTIPNDIIKDRIRKGIHSDFLRFPTLITGSYDSTLGVWDLRKGKLKFHLKGEHYDCITALTLHIPSNKTDNPFIVSGSSDRFICIWDLFTGKLIHKFIGHSERINCFATFIPPSSSVSNRGSIKGSFLRASTSGITAAVVSTSIVKADFQNTTSNQDIKEEKKSDIPGSPSSLPSQSNKYTRNDEGNDSMISLFGNQTLEEEGSVGSRSKHSTKSLPVNLQSFPIPLLLSGGDDNTTIIWEDCIYYKPFLPLRDEINRCFDYDRTKKDWPLITCYVKKYHTKFFYENSHLFYLSVRYHRPDFLLKFRYYLTRYIPYLKKVSAQQTQNLLNYALQQSDLISFRIILLSWIEALNTDITDILYQKLYHSIYYFDDTDLLLMAKKYPVEYKHFIISLKLIRNHTTLLHDANAHYRRGAYHPTNNTSNKRRRRSAGLLTSLQDSELSIINYNTSNEAFDNDTLNPIRLMKLHPSYRYEVTGSFHRYAKFNEVWNRNEMEKVKTRLLRYNSTFLENPHSSGPRNTDTNTNNTNTNSNSNAPLNPLGPKQKSKNSLIAAFANRANNNGPQRHGPPLLDNDSIRGRGPMPLRRTASLSNLRPITSYYQEFNDSYYESYTYWNRFFVNFFLDSSDPQPVTTLLVPLKYTAKLKESLELFVKVSNQLDSVEIFNSEISIVSFRYFWDSHAKFYHIRAFFRYCLLLTIFTLTLTIYQFYNEGGINQSNDYHQRLQFMKGDAYRSGSEVGLKILNVITFLFFLYYSYEEISQMRYYNIVTVKALFLHFLDLWNFVDITIIITGAVGFLLRILYTYDTTEGRCILAVTSIFVWFKFLYFLRPFSNSGPLVTMIIQIAYDIRFFVIVLIVVLIGFTFAFWTLANTNPSLDFGTLSSAFFTSFAYMIGQAINRDFTGVASPSFLTFLIVIFMMAMWVVMLNLLIALMGDTFAKVRSKGLAIWRKEQASIIIEESFLFSKVLQQKIPPFLHVLKYTTDIGNYEKNSINSSVNNEDTNDDDDGNVNQSFTGSGTSRNGKYQILMRLINQNKIHMIPFTELIIQEENYQVDSDDDDEAVNHHLAGGSGGTGGHHYSSHYEDFYEYYKQNVQTADIDLALQAINPEEMVRTRTISATELGDSDLSDDDDEDSEGDHHEEHKVNIGGDDTSLIAFTTPMKGESQEGDSEREGDEDDEEDDDEDEREDKLRSVKRIVPHQHHSSIMSASGEPTIDQEENNDDEVSLLSMSRSRAGKHRTTTQRRSSIF